MLPQNKNLKSFARKLRNNATRHENRLWYDFLRDYPLRFNRQMIILNYIADFYCAKARLVIELEVLSTTPKKAYPAMLQGKRYLTHSIWRCCALTTLISTKPLKVCAEQSIQQFSGEQDSRHNYVQITRPCGATLFAKEGKESANIWIAVFPFYIPSRLNLVCNVAVFGLFAVPAFLCSSS